MDKRSSLKIKADSLKHEIVSKLTTLKKNAPAVIVSVVLTASMLTAIAANQAAWKSQKKATVPTKNDPKVESRSYGLMPANDESSSLPLKALIYENPNQFQFEIEVPNDPNRKETKYEIEIPFDKFKDLDGFDDFIAEVVKLCIYNDCTNTEANEMHVPGALSLLEKRLAEWGKEKNPDYPKGTFPKGEEWKNIDALWSTFYDQTMLHPGVIEWGEEIAPRPESKTEPTTAAPPGRGIIPGATTASTTTTEQPTTVTPPGRGVIPKTAVEPTIEP